MSHHLAIRWIAAALLTLSIALCGFAWMRLLDEQAGEIEVSREHYEQRVTLMNEAVDQQVDAIIRSVDVALKHLRMVYVEHRQDFPRAVEEIMNAYPKGMLQFVTVFGPDGHPRYSTADTSARAYFGDREHFSVHLERDTDELFISPPIVGGLASVPLVQMTRPIRSGNRLIGVIAIPLRPDYLSQQLGRLHTHPKDLLAIVRNDGSMISRSPYIEDILTTKVAPERPFLHARPGERGIFRAPSTLEKIPLLFAWSRLADWPLSSVVGFNEEEELQGILQRQRTERVTGAIAMLILLALSAWLAWLLVRLGNNNAALANERRRLNDILLGTNVGTWEWNVQTGETIFNERWAEIIGYTLAELAPISIKTWAELCHPDDLKASGELLARHFSGDIAYYEFEARMRHKDGHWVWVLDRGKVVSRTPDGQPLLMSGTHQDVTERRHDLEELQNYRQHLERLVEARTADLSVAKDAAEAASRAKSAFLSMASHELRTPMNGVMGTISLALRAAKDPKQIDYLNKADRASRQLLAIINDVLEISRIEANQLRIASVDFLLRDVLAQVRDVVEGAATAKRLSLDIDIDESLQRRTLVGDPTRIGQILINLIGNATKFTQRGGIALHAHLDVSQPEKPRLCFEVADTGIGIAAADQERIFHPFEQVDSSESRAFGGTGLGLALCRRFVYAMGGTIGVNSQPGVGSRFWFDVHVGLREGSETPASVSPVELDAQIRREFPGATILLADDEPLNLEITQAILEQAGLRVTLASDGSEALTQIQNGRFDLILLDINMPRLSGLEVAQQVRALPGTSGKTPIVAFTANAFEEDRDACLNAGIDDHIGKPVMPETLYATLLTWLRWGRAHGSVHA